MNEPERDAVAELVALAERPAADAERAARVSRNVQAVWRGSMARRRNVRRLSIAATVIVAVAAPLLVRQMRPAPVPGRVAPPVVVAYVQAVHGTSALSAQQRFRAGEEISVPAGATASLQWQDVILRVDGGTRLRLDRRGAVIHNGAVYYSADAGHGGVTFRTPFGAVRDIGTRFELRLGTDSMRVRVRDGSVAVRGVTATSGHEVVATADRVVNRAIATTGAEWAWIENAAPPIILEGQHLSAVLRHIADEKGLTLVWRGKDQILRGSRPLSTTDALDAAAAAADLTYRIEDGRLVVEGK